MACGYASELHPNTVSIPAVPTVHPTASNPTAARSNRDRQGRRLWLWALPVVAACSVIAVVLPLALGGSTFTSISTSTSMSASSSTSTSTSTPHANAGTMDLTGTYVGVGDDNSLTMLLELTQAKNSLMGSLIVSGSHYAPTLGNKPAKVTGTVDVTTESVSGSVPAFGLSFNGNVSGTSLALSLSRFGEPEDENELTIVFRRGTVSEFRELTNKSTPPAANAQMNLVNAVTVAMALYQVSMSYTGPDHSYGLETFAQQAPEFDWTSKQCNPGGTTCVSLRVLDLASDNDAQGIALSVYSAKTSSCWYAIDIEVTPRLLQNDHSAFVATTSDPNASVKKPGVYYAKGPATAPSFCIASLVLHPHKAAWGTSFANAGVLS